MQWETAPYREFKCLSTLVFKVVAQSTSSTRKLMSKSACGSFRT